MHDTIDRASDLAKFWWNLGQLTMDSHSVVAMRLMGLFGAWSVPHGENQAMFDEKAPAFTEGLVAGTFAAFSGHGPDRVMQAAVAPISDKARENRSRLADRGPNIFSQNTYIE